MSEETITRPAEPSEAQAIYDRLLAQCNRLSLVRKRFDQVLLTIAHVKTAGAPAGDDIRPPKGKSYLAALNVVADCNEAEIAKLDARIEDLARLFST
jgi:hypothetical protein